MNTEYKSKPWLAVLLNVFAPGLGFVYLNQLALAVANILFFPILLLFAGRSSVIFSALGFFLVTTLLICAWFASLVVVFQLARRRPLAERGLFQRWYALLLLGMAVNAAIQFCSARRGELFGYDVFNVPGASMETTLLVGDKFIANTLAFQNHNPQRGDVVVLQNPAKPEFKYVKRIVGLPGEQVDLHDNKLFINGKAIPDAHSFYDLNKSVPISEQPYIVPPDSYFVLGDNRNNSLDSRHFGPVPREKIYAQAEMVWFSFGIDSLRMNRIGLAIK